MVLVATNVDHSHVVHAAGACLLRLNGCAVLHDTAHGLTKISRLFYRKDEELVRSSGPLVSIPSVQAEHMNPHHTQPQDPARDRPPPCMQAHTLRGACCP